MATTAMLSYIQTICLMILQVQITSSNLRMNSRLIKLIYELINLGNLYFTCIVFIKYLKYLLILLPINIELTLNICTISLEFIFLIIFRMGSMIYCRLILSFLPLNILNKLVLIILRVLSISLYSTHLIIPLNYLNPVFALDMLSWTLFRVFPFLLIYNY